MQTNDKSIEEALQTCATEPVHIPGIVQPFGCLLALHAQTGVIEYASENCRAILGEDASALLGKVFSEVFSRDIAHALNNASASATFDKQSTPFGSFLFNDKQLAASGFASGAYLVTQFERDQDPELGGGDALNALSYLMREVQSCESQEKLFALSTELLRHLTGYDRVMVYRFDPQFNGEIIAEARQRSMDTFMGLHFPHWDIPAQARAIMGQIPLRFIEDVAQEPASLLAARGTTPPLDITFAEARGVSPVHMEYLRNMGVKSTMTLSVMLGGALWGIISFHHRRPRVPAPQTRALLSAFIEIFSAKLSLLRKQAQLDLSKRIDLIKDEALGSIDEAAVAQELAAAGPTITEVMQCDGIAVMTGSAVKKYGQIPDQSVLDALADLIRNSNARPVIVESLSEDFPQLVAGSQGIAGALCVPGGADRSLFLFRREVSTTVKWAGNPQKNIEVTDGLSRLRPRGSFSVYLTEQSGKCKAWTEDDLHIAERIWALIDSAERRALRNRLHKQQDLMINELNHRVRNILSLVRSVSRQARRHNSSLESYSEAIERRIQALAAAHDLASDTSKAATSIKQLIEVEVAPYDKGGKLVMTGDNQNVRKDVAPILALVMHELATNAAKYGAFSSDEGTVNIKISRTDGGMQLVWRESNGPRVTPPGARGFGSTLIQQAIPFEMGGRAELKFPATGVEADLFLPNEILEFSREPQTGLSQARRIGADDHPIADFDPEIIPGYCLVLEDNYTIAKDMGDQLSDAGVEDVEIVSNPKDAMEAIDGELPAFAILDVNLGPGRTSETVALHLLAKNVPFIFATGYGDKAELAAGLDHVTRLTKPVTSHDVLAAIMDAFKPSAT